MSKQLPYKRHKQRTLYDWAESEGWSELRYDEQDAVWRGFAPRSYIEEEVPFEVLIEFAPATLRVDYGRLCNCLDDLRWQGFKIFLDEGISPGELDPENPDYNLIARHQAYFLSLTLAQQHIDQFELAFKPTIAAYIADR
jgi:hypothetical protein